MRKSKETADITWWKMPEKITVNMEFIKNFKTIYFGMENCEGFDIPTEYVLDISFEAVKKPSQWGRDYYFAEDGFVKIAKAAQNVLGRDYEQYGDELLDEDCDINYYKFVNRMTEYNDLTSIDLVDEQRRKIPVVVPYGPVIEVISGTEMEYSSCASFEVDDNGDMEIRFGKLSKNPIIPRNNYHELIENWTEILGNFKPEHFTFDFRWISGDFKIDGERSLSIACVIDNKERKKQAVTLVFEDIESVEFFTWCAGTDSELYITKLTNGKIYAGLGESCSIVCAKCRAEETLL